MSHKTKKLLFFSYITFLLFLLVYPTNSTGIDLNFYIFGIRSDHWIHAMVFIPFLVLLFLAFNRTHYLVALFFGVFFASFCESLHYFLPYRDFSIQDFYANITGIIVGSFSYFFLKEKF